MSRTAVAWVWGLEGLGFIVMCWYVPGRNVRAQKGTAASPGYSPPFMASAQFCPAFSICRQALMAISVHEFPLSPPQEQRWPLLVSYVLGRRGGLSFSVLLQNPLNESNKAQLTSQPLLHPHAPPSREQFVLAAH